MSAGYGSIEVLRDLSFDIPEGKVVTLLGGNGAGKTTTMNAIAGLVPLRGGTVELDGEPLNRRPAHEIFAKGIALVAQTRELFKDMTVRENLELGVLAQPHVKDIEARVDEIFEMFPRLKERECNRAGSLSGGEQQMLATGRALMSRPRILLLDEPTTGLAPIIVGELQRIIRRINAAGHTVLLVEQNTKMALELADHVYVLSRGRIALSRPRSEISDQREIFDAYLH
jgi:branched-chain amino acid transport system ATP-binding protein